MSSLYTTVPASAILTLGGFTGYKAAEWNQFFWDSVRRFHPWYYLRHRFDRSSTTWKVNDCVYDALKQYLLQDFGIVLPERTLFQVYNHSGKGILPKDLLKAISAVIEPLGLEIEQVVVANDILRKALGYSDRVTDLSGAAFLDGKPGICMINLKEGFSHAFYWKSMRVHKFHETAFRLAVCLHWKAAQETLFSYLSGLSSYRQMLEVFFENHPQLSNKSTMQILSQIVALQSACDESNQSFPDHHETMAAELESILSKVHLILPRKASSETRDLIEAGAMLTTIFRPPVQTA